MQQASQRRQPRPARRERVASRIACGACVDQRAKDTPSAVLALRPARSRPALPVHGGQPARADRVLHPRHLRARGWRCWRLAGRRRSPGSASCWRPRPWCCSSRRSSSTTDSGSTTWSAGFEAALYFYVGDRADPLHVRRPRRDDRRALRGRCDVHLGGLGLRLRLRRRAGGRAAVVHGRRRSRRALGRGWSCCS